MITLQPVGTCLNDRRVYEATLKAGQRGKAHVRESQAAPVPNDFQDPQVYMGAQTSIIPLQQQMTADACLQTADTAQVQCPSDMQRGTQCKSRRAAC